MASAVLDRVAEAEHALAAYVAADRAKPLLRFVTCGSVDDGKSTLIGRMLYDGKRLFSDQLERLEEDSRRHGTQGGGLDFALLVDGLADERAQGITIDVAYRYFASERRKFIVADAPGHEQYTRNMVTAASTADAALLLIDAARGITAQTRRHAHIVALLGVRTVVLAVNKMDLVGYDPARFAAIAAGFEQGAADAGIAGFSTIPMSALTGDNVFHRGPAMPWYDGPTLIEVLDTAPTTSDAAGGGFALPVQWVNRRDAGFRGVAGTIARGSVAPGDAVVVLPGGQRSRVARIVTFDGDLASASAGRAVTIELADQVECAAGAMLAAAADAPPVTERLSADLIWFDAAPLSPGRRYLLQTGTRLVPARVRIERIVAIPDAPPPGAQLEMNGLARVTVETERPVAVLPYADSRALGSFLLIDRESSATLAAGMVRTGLGEVAQVSRYQAPVYAMAGAQATAAALVARRQAAGIPAMLLDEATLRAGIAADLSHDAVDALWRRATATATLLAQAGVTVALTVVPPAGADDYGEPWSGDDTATDWVI